VEWGGYVREGLHLVCNESYGKFRICRQDNTTVSNYNENELTEGGGGESINIRNSEVESGSATLLIG
jgi:hypothetical protein